MVLEETVNVMELVYGRANGYVSARVDGSDVGILYRDTTSKADFRSLCHK